MGCVITERANRRWFLEENVPGGQAGRFVEVDCWPTFGDANVRVQIAVDNLIIDFGWAHTACNRTPNSCRDVVQIPVRFRAHGCFIRSNVFACLIECNPSPEQWIVDAILLKDFCCGAGGLVVPFSV